MIYDDEERRKDLPFPSPRGDVFYRRGGLLPPCHREAADFAGVAVSVLKTEIAAFTKDKSVRSQGPHPLVIASEAWRSPQFTSSLRATARSVAISGNLSLHLICPCV